MKIPLKKKPVTSPASPAAASLRPQLSLKRPPFRDAVRILRISMLLTGQHKAKLGQYTKWGGLKKKLGIFLLGQFLCFPCFLIRKCIACALYLCFCVLWQKAFVYVFVWLCFCVFCVILLKYVLCVLCPCVFVFQAKKQLSVSLFGCVFVFFVLFC